MQSKSANLHSTMVSINHFCRDHPTGTYVHLHSTMVSINQSMIFLCCVLQGYLHSTMVSINHQTGTNTYTDVFIYIPLWYLLIQAVFSDALRSGLIYIPLWYLLISVSPRIPSRTILHLHSTMVSINPVLYIVPVGNIFIYIPLWYLLIHRRYTAVHIRKTFTFHYGIY